MYINVLNSFRADVILTDLPMLQPLLEKNIESNKGVLKGKVKSAALSWGEDTDKFSSPDIILVSDCVYYDRVWFFLLIDKFIFCD